MWSEKIETFQKNNKQALDLKLELHLSIYIKNLLDDTVEFKVNDGSVTIIMEDKELSHDEFFYWWQITRFDEIISEEELTFHEFNTLKEKITKAIEKVKDPVIKGSDSLLDTQKKTKKITDNKDKVSKLSLHLKEEADKSNMKINSLKNFRSIYPTRESLERFTKNIKVLLSNE
jgi:hypothetical protein